MNILMLVLLLFIGSYVYSAHGTAPDLTQIIKNDGEIMCFAGGSEINSALDWTYPIPNKSEDLLKSDLYYVPHINNDFGCNFETEKSCSSEWTLSEWSLSESSYPLTDTRWEDFKMMYIRDNLHEAIDRKITIPSVFDLGISIRSNNGVTIWLCEGWRPDKHSCFLLKIGLQNKRIITLERNDNVMKPINFQRFSDIFSEHEWKHFRLSYNDKQYLELTDVLQNETLFYYSGEESVTLKPIFLFMTSTSPSLWKIHNNHFLYTNVSTVTKFGPRISAASSEICILLYVSMCLDCSMEFFIEKNCTKNIVANISLEQTENSKSPEWRSIKFTIHDNEEDYVQLYVETISTAGDRFWKVDSARLCNDQEIKVTTLSVQKKLSLEEDAQISCYTLLSPEWTPNKQRLLTSTDLPIIDHELSSTMIKLSWTQTNLGSFPRYYVIKYEGSDLCESNTTLPSKQQYRSAKRLKSNGWIITNSNAAVIKNLIPYTYYSIMFQDLIYPQNRTLSLNTITTDKPMPEELPQNVRIKNMEDSAKVFFDTAKCNTTYGPLVYRVKFYNEALNFSQQFIDVKNNYAVENLLPFTNYNLTMEIARNVNSLNYPNLKFIQYYNFTTRPDVAPLVRDLEIYETDETSIGIRFDLPDPAKGQPKYIRIQHCHPLYLNGCEFEINDISKCKIWDSKYCAEAKDLIRNHSYWLAVSLKNENTHSFGKESHILAITIEKVPAPPTNVAYKILHYNEKTDYYDVNISWSHPYYPNGSITAFDVFLFEENRIADKSIHEILQIPNKLYQQEYVKSIKFVPYVNKYNISVRAINNKYKSAFTSIEIRTDHFKDYVDQVPNIVNHTSTSVFVNVPPLDIRLGTYTLIVIVQNTNNKAAIDQKLVLLADDNLCLDNVETWIAQILEITEDRIPLIEIGDGAETITLNHTIINKSLQPNNKYCFNFVIKNVYKKTEHVIVYHEKYLNSISEDSSESHTSLIIVLIVVIVIVAIGVGIIFYRYGKDIICRQRYRQEGEHIYEAMPFDDYSEPKVVFNSVYDKLQH